MIQLNLLPDVKQEYIHAQRSQRLISSIAVFAAIASVVLLVLLLSVGGLQKKHLNDLNQDIATDTSALQKKPQIGKILTVQNQLQSLTALHDGKPAVARLFDYLNDVTPVQTSITSLSVDFALQTVTITGSADNLGSVNKYIDALKFTTYTSDTSKDKAFSNVVLTSFGLSTNATNKNQAATYTITMSYDKNIFDITQEVKLIVPNLTTTRSEIDKPSDLFTPSTEGAGN